MHFETNQGVNGDVAREMSKCIRDGPIHHRKHSNLSNVDNYWNPMVPNSVTPTSSISVSPSPSSTLEDAQMQFLQPCSSPTEYIVPQTQTMLPILLQGGNLEAQRYEDQQQIVNAGRSELLGDIIGAGTFDLAAGRTNTTWDDNIISHPKGLQIQSIWVDFTMNHDDQNSQMDASKSKHSKILAGNHNQTNRSITFSLEDGKNSSIYSTDAVNKPRMRWTQNLNNCFVQAINDLGGAEKATPKCIHKKMGIEGLTIYHVKSHLQKYRQMRYQPDTKEDRRFESTNRSASPEKESEPLKKSAPESEALRLQWELQKSLHDQLEFQRELQLRAEENARQLKKLLEEYKKVGEAIMLGRKSFSSKYPAVTAGPSSTRLDLAQDQLNDRSN